MLAMDVEIDRDEVVDLAHKGMLSALYARIKPNAVAIHAPRGNRTFKQLHENANLLAAALRRAGLKPGDHMALICPNTAEFVEVMAANLRSGFRLTPINWHLSAPEAAYIVNDCKAKALIVHAGLPGANPADAAGAGDLIDDLIVDQGESRG